MQDTEIKPRVVVSKCLGFEACRYNGQLIRNDFLQALQPFVDFVFVCPEVEIGLGTPRDPIRLVGKTGKRLRLVQPSTGRDITGQMQSFSSSFLASLGPVEGFVLKSASPSCGLQDAKFYSKPENSPTLGKGPGMFAREVLDRFSHLAIEDEGRLMNLRIREHFLIKLFALARWRRLKGSPSRGELVAFQASHKLLLMAYNQTRMRRLGRIVAEAKKRGIAQTLEDYGREFCQALAQMARFNSHINVLMHAFGYVSEHLSGREKRHFLDMLDLYRARKLTVSAPISVLRSWLIRFEVGYLLGQVYFDPFPLELVNLADSGKGRGDFAQSRKGR